MPYKHASKQIISRNDDLLNIARNCIACGIALMPVGDDKLPHWPSLPTNPETEKKTWKPFAKKRATIGDVEKWLANGATGLAAICGQASGGLLVWDIDIRPFFGKWTRHACVASTRRVSDIFREHQVPIQITGGDGLQIFMRCDKPEQARKLAWAPDETLPSGRKIAIETRAEGNYAILPGSLHPSGNHYQVWDIYQNNFDRFPKLSMADVNVLFSQALACCEAPKSKQQIERKKERPAILKKARSRNFDGESVIDLFNNTYDIEEILSKEGYTYCHGTRYARPGGTNPSVNVFLNSNTSYHHSTNDPLSDGHAKTPFNVWCWYNHFDNVQEAVKEAATLLGISYETQKKSPFQYPPPSNPLARDQPPHESNQDAPEYEERLTANKAINQARMANPPTANDIAVAKQSIVRISQNRPWEQVGAALKGGIFDKGLPLWQKWSHPDQAKGCTQLWPELIPLTNGLQILEEWADQDDPPAPMLCISPEFSFEELKSKIEQAIQEKTDKDELVEIMDEWVTSAAHLKKNEINKLCRLLKKAGVTSRNLQYWRADIKETSKEIEETHKAATLNQDDDKILVTLHSLGYTFRLNQCNEYIEVNGENLTDPLAAKIRVQMRKLKFHSMPAVEDTYIANAYDNGYHPLKDYLRSLRDKWDGEDHIAKLASYFEDAHEPILCDDGIERTLAHVYLRRWTIGCVAKVFGDGQFKNYCIVFEGKQGLGKSYVIVWLASVMPRYFIEDEVRPSNKDHKLRLTSNWLWEIAELGSTTRKADVEALKHFITTGTIKVRPPYARYPIHKPAITSFFGTVNDDDGFLRDRTGNRRFLCVSLLDINRNYSKDMKPEQIWAQAVALYLQGETGELTKVEEKTRDNNNQQYQVTNPAEDWIFKYYKKDPTGIEFTTDIVQTLQDHNYRGTTKAIQMDVSSTLRSLGFEKKQITLGNTRGMAFFGLRKIQPPRCPNCGEMEGSFFFKFKSEKYKGDEVWHCKACHDPNENQQSFWYPKEIEDL